MNAMLLNKFMSNRFTSVSTLDYYVYFIRHLMIRNGLISAYGLDKQSGNHINKLTFVSDKRKWKKYINNLVYYYENTALENFIKNVSFYREVKAEKLLNDERTSIFGLTMLKNVKVDSIYELTINKITDTIKKNSGNMIAIEPITTVINNKDEQILINGIYSRNYYYDLEINDNKDVYEISNVESGTDSRKIGRIVVDIYKMAERLDKYIYDKNMRWFLNVIENERNRIKTRLTATISNENSDVRLSPRSGFRCILTFNTVGNLYQPHESIIGIGMNSILQVNTNIQTHDIRTHVNFVFLIRNVDCKMIYHAKMSNLVYTQSGAYRTKQMEVFSADAINGIDDIVLDKPFDNLLRHNRDMFSRKLNMLKLFGR